MFCEIRWTHSSFLSITATATARQFFYTFKMIWLIGWSTTPGYRPYDYEGDLFIYLLFLKLTLFDPR